MKYGGLLIGLSLLMAGPELSLAQDGGGLKKLGQGPASTTRAVVVGISRYGEGIRSLQYAHKDAQAFADFLKSKAGGEVPEENIRFLVNEDATLAAIDDALYWLKSSSQKDDKAIFYFSGHGDVEIDAHWQFGYLLCSDSPPNNFRNNAVRVEDLDLLAIDLSSLREARTVFIIDACRSGTLSEGRQVPHSYLANQKKNEVRILSCRGDQVSIEGPQWGGGRGVFSWHLLRGLNGLAHDPDLGEDPDAVTLEELNLFLRKQMRRSTQELVPPAYQDPLVSGEDRFLLARIDPDILAETQAADLMVQKPDGDIASRGVQDEIGQDAEADAGPMTPHRFFSYLKQIRWLDNVDLRPLLQTTPGKLPGAFLELVHTVDTALVEAGWSEREALEEAKVEDLADPEDPADVEQFNLRLAVFLHDYGQELINRYLKLDKSEIGARAYHTAEESVYARHPAVFELALELLPPDHPLAGRLRIKQKYYSGVAYRIYATGQPGFETALQKALAIQEEALAMDDKAPYIHNEMGIIYRSLGRLDMAIRHFDEAASLAPSWGLPDHNRAVVYYQQNEMVASRKMAEAALVKAPHYFGAHIMMGQHWELAGNLLRAEEAYYRAHKLEPGHFLPHRYLGFLYLETGELPEAEEQLVLFREKSRGIPKIILRDPVSSMVLPATITIPLEPLPPMDLTKVVDPQVAWDYAIHQMQADAFPEAEAGLKRVIELDPAFPNVWLQLSWLYHRTERWSESDWAVRIARERNGDAFPVLMLHADILEKWGRYDSAIPLMEEVLRQQPTMTPVFDRLGRLYEKAGRPQAAEALYGRLRQVDGPLGVSRLYALYQSMRHRLPQDARWAFRMAEFYRPFSQAVAADLGMKYVARPVLGPSHDSGYVPPLVDGKLEEMVAPLFGLIPQDLTTWPNVCMAHDALLDFLAAAPLDTLERVQVFDMQAEIRIKREKWEEALAAIRPALDMRTALVDGQDRLLEVYAHYPFPYEEKDVLDHQHGLGLLRFPAHLRLARGYLLEQQYRNGEQLLRLAAGMDLDGRHTEDMAWLQVSGKWIQGDMRRAEVVCRSLLESGRGEQAAYMLARIAAANRQRRDALRWMEQALERGFRYGEILVHDPLMDPLRDSPEWTGLLAKHAVSLPE